MYQLDKARPVDALVAQAAREGGVIVGLIWVLITDIKNWDGLAVAVFVLVCAMAVAARRRHNAINVVAVVIVVGLAAAEYLHLLS